MAARMKERYDHTEGCEKPLGVSDRVEAPHAPFSFSRWLVGILGSIVRSLILYVLDMGQYFRFDCGITAQLVSDDGPRNVLQSFEQPSEDLLRGFLVPARLHQDIEYLAVLIDSAQQILQLSIYREEQIISTMRILQTIEDYKSRGRGGQPIRVVTKRRPK